MHRYSCTVIAFGQTGSGKTYTLTGPVNLVGHMALFSAN